MDDRPTADAETPAYPIQGDFVLGGDDSPVAVCTLASHGLLPPLRGRPEVAIAGRVYTENLGIETMVQNLLANPRLRVLLVCGRESRHRVGQAILSLHRNGVDPVTHRIRGATGPEPVVPNLTAQQVAAFQERFELVDLVGELDPERVLERARAWASGAAGPAEPPARPEQRPDEPPLIQAELDRPGAWTFDRLGFFLIRLDPAGGRLLLDHYGQDRRLLHRLVGDSAAALSQTAVRLGLLGELAHAAYLGRELARAELALREGRPYEQDSSIKG